MKEYLVSVSRSPAQSYILSLKCECGGTYEAVKPLKIDVEKGLVLHKCSSCGQSLYIDGIYPSVSAVSNGESEPFGMADVWIED